jgi:hypothetical protein
MLNTLINPLPRTRPILAGSAAKRLQRPSGKTGRRDSGVPFEAPVFPLSPSGSTAFQLCEIFLLGDARAATEKVEKGD